MRAPAKFQRFLTAKMNRNERTDKAAACRRLLERGPEDNGRPGFDNSPGAAKAPTATPTLFSSLVPDQNVIYSSRLLVSISACKHGDCWMRFLCIVLHDHLNVSIAVGHFYAEIVL